MAIIKSGATSDNLTVDATSKAARVTLYDSTGRETSLGSKPSFYMAGTFTPPATPTDMVTIYGSATKTVKIYSFVITTTNTAASSQQFTLLRRSSVNTAGTFVAGTAVQGDTTDATTTATNFGHYTANPSSTGTLVGNINIVRVASPVATPASFAGVVQNAGYDLLSTQSQVGTNRVITLRGTAQGLCLNFAGAALATGQTHAYSVYWTEE